MSTNALADEQRCKLCKVSFAICPLRQIGYLKTFNNNYNMQMSRKVDSVTINQIIKIGTRPDTRPKPVADGWAGAEMRVFTLSNSIITDGPTGGQSLL